MVVPTRPTAPPIWWKWICDIGEGIRVPCSRAAVDHLVAEIGDESPAEVVAQSRRCSAVEHALQRRIRHRPEQVDRRAEGTQRPERRRHPRQIPAPAADEHHDRLPTSSGGTNGSGGAC